MEIRFEYPRCLNVTEQSMHGTHFELFLQRYVIPALAVFGIVGNCLNLSVLLKMRSRSNTFLSLLAFADIIFLILLLPNVFANIPFFTFNYSFRYFYYFTKFHLLSIGNWCSAIAIWCVIAVCTERLIGIRRPLYVRDQWAKWKMPLIIVLIISVTGLLTAYQHFQHFCLTGHFCNGTQLYQRCLKVTDETWFKTGNNTNPYSMSFRRFIDISVHIYVDSMILFPIFLLSILNFLLICALRQRRRNSMLYDETRLSVTPVTLNPSNVNRLKKPRPSNESNIMARTEHRVTITVTFIVTAFTITNGPSAILQLVRTAYGIHDRKHYDITMICNILVICGKASNFILFCLGSRHFRDRLIATLTGAPKNFSTPGYRKGSCDSTRGVSFWLRRILSPSSLRKKQTKSPPDLRIGLIQPEKSSLTINKM